MNGRPLFLSVPGAHLPSCWGQHEIFHGGRNGYFTRLWRSFVIGFPRVLRQCCNPPVLILSSNGAVLEEKDVSTISRGEDGFGILASDEGATIQILRFSSDGTGATVHGEITLAEPATLELDLEASTFHQGWFYVIGSHGVAKKKAHRGTARQDLSLQTGTRGRRGG